MSQTQDVEVRVEHGLFHLLDADPDAFTPFTVIPDDRLWAAIIGQRVWIVSGGSDHYASVQLHALTADDVPAQLNSGLGGYLHCTTGSVQLWTLTLGPASEPFALTAGPGWYCVHLTRTGAEVVQDAISRSLQDHTFPPTGIEKYVVRFWPARTG